MKIKDLFPDEDVRDATFAWLDEPLYEEDVEELTKQRPKISAWELRESYYRDKPNTKKEKKEKENYEDMY